MSFAIPAREAGASPILVVDSSAMLEDMGLADAPIESQQIYEYIRKLYSARIKSLCEKLASLTMSIASDELLQTMGSRTESAQYLSERALELIQTAFISDRERYIEDLAQRCALLELELGHTQSTTQAANGAGSFVSPQVQVTQSPKDTTLPDRVSLYLERILVQIQREEGPAIGKAEIARELRLLSTVVQDARKVELLSDHIGSLTVSLKDSFSQSVQSTEHERLQISALTDELMAARSANEIAKSAQDSLLEQNNKLQGKLMENHQYYKQRYAEQKESLQQKEREIVQLKAALNGSTVGDSIKQEFEALRSEFRRSVFEIRDQFAHNLSEDHAGKTSNDLENIRKTMQSSLNNLNKEIQDLRKSRPNQEFSREISRLRDEVSRSITQIATSGDTGGSKLAHDDIAELRNTVTQSLQNIMDHVQELKSSSSMASQQRAHIEQILDTKMTALRGEMTRSLTDLATLMNTRIEQAAATGMDDRLMSSMENMLAEHVHSMRSQMESSLANVRQEMAKSSQVNLSQADNDQVLYAVEGVMQRGLHQMREELDASISVLAKEVDTLKATQTGSLQSINEAIATAQGQGLHLDARMTEIEQSASNEEIKQLIREEISSLQQNFGGSLTDLQRTIENVKRGGVEGEMSSMEEIAQSLRDELSGQISNVKKDLQTSLSHLSANVTDWKRTHEDTAPAGAQQGVAENQIMLHLADIKSDMERSITDLNRQLRDLQETEIAFTPRSRPVTEQTLTSRLQEMDVTEDFKAQLDDMHSLIHDTFNAVMKEVAKPSPKKTDKGASSTRSPQRPIATSPPPNLRTVTPETKRRVSKVNRLLEDLINAGQTDEKDMNQSLLDLLDLKQNVEGMKRKMHITREDEREYLSTSEPGAVMHEITQELLDNMDEVSDPELRHLMTKCTLHLSEVLELNDSGYASDDAADKTRDCIKTLQELSRVLLIADRKAIASMGSLRKYALISDIEAILQFLRKVISAHEELRAVNTVERGTSPVRNSPPRAMASSAVGTSPGVPSVVAPQALEPSASTLASDNKAREERRKRKIAETKLLEVAKKFEEVKNRMNEKSAVIKEMRTEMQRLREEADVEKEGRIALQKQLDLRVDELLQREKEIEQVRNHCEQIEAQLLASQRGLHVEKIKSNKLLSQMGGMDPGFDIAALNATRMRLQSMETMARHRLGDKEEPLTREARLDLYARTVELLVAQALSKTSRQSQEVGTGAVPSNTSMASTSAQADTMTSTEPKHSLKQLDDLDQRYKDLMETSGLQSEQASQDIAGSLIRIIDDYRGLLENVRPSLSRQSSPSRTSKASQGASAAVRPGPSVAEADSLAMRIQSLEEEMQSTRHYRNNLTQAKQIIRAASQKGEEVRELRAALNRSLRDVSNRPPPQSTLDTSTQLEAETERLLREYHTVSQRPAPRESSPAP
eukprot:Clim_evm48s153 gene=Clim_evmTU48s153